MVVTFHNDRDFMLDSRNFSKRVWKKICLNFNIDKKNVKNVLWLEFPKNSIDFICHPNFVNGEKSTTKTNKKSNVRKILNEDKQYEKK